ncbi:MAG: hypothetical protein ACR2HR_06090 [Euzebya sp.]
MTRGPLKRLMLLLVLIGGAVGIYYARRELIEPIDRTGAAVPLETTRGSVGASADAFVVHRQSEPQWIRDLAHWTPDRPRTGMGRACAYVWAAPSSAAGLIVGLLSGTVPTVRDGVLVFGGARGLPGLLLTRGRYAATTLGHVVIARGEPSAVLMAHELAHTRQAERLGPFFGPVYWYLLARHGYIGHPLERAARIAGRRARLPVAR